MKNIAWAGRSDARHLSAADFAKAGVELDESQSFIFPRFTPVSVPDEVAAALVANPRLFGAFELPQVQEADTLDFEVPSEKTETPAPKKSASKSTSSAD